MSFYNVAEKFVSINGEGAKAGAPAVFIRFCGCNLNCGYCDTRWANYAGTKPVKASAEEILSYVKSAGINCVTLTGGEPLLQRDIGELIVLLGGNGAAVEIETNGSIPIGEFSSLDPRPAFTLDYKLPSSGMESEMLTENFNYLSPQDTVKFVAGDMRDLARAEEIIAKFGLTGKCNLFLSPVYGKIQPGKIVGFMKERRLNGVRLQLQLHKIIWNPDARGV